MRIDVLGTFEGYDQGARTGDVLDVSEISARHYVSLGYAEFVESKSAPPVEKAIEPQENIETASLSEPGNKPKVLDEPEDKAPVKRSPAKRTPRSRTRK